MTERKTGPDVCLHHFGVLWWVSSEKVECSAD